MRGCRGDVFHYLYGLGVDAAFLQPVLIFLKIISRVCQYYGIFSEQPKVISNISVRTSEIGAQSFHWKRNIENMNLVRYDILGKISMKIHYAIVSERSGN